MFWASAWIAFRLFYGAWPPYAGKLGPWLASDSRAKWSLFGSIIVGLFVAALSRRGMQGGTSGNPEIDQLMRRGYASHEQKEIPKALEYFQSALNLCPKDDRVVAARIHASMGKAYFDSGDLTCAKESLVKASELFKVSSRGGEELNHVHSLLELVDERQRIVDKPMPYRDSRYGFTFEIPAGWVQQALVSEFSSTGGRVALSHYSHAATFNVSAGRLKELEFRIAEVRASSVEDFMNKISGRCSDVAITQGPFAGESNVVIGECDTKNMVAGSPRLRRQGFISVLRQGTEYVIQWSAEPSLQVETRRLLASFAFT